MLMAPNDFNATSEMNPAIKALLLLHVIPQHWF